MNKNAESKKDIPRVYDQIAEEYRHRITRPTDYINCFTAFLPDGARILDAGCGIGTDAGYLSQSGYEVAAIDLSRGMLEIARTNHEAAVFYEQDLRYPDFKPHSFDGIIASFSLIHIPKGQIPGVLKKYHELLVNRGILFLAMQAGESRELYLKEPFKPDETTFLNVVSEEEILHQLHQAGFDVVERYERDPDEDQEFNFTKLFLLARKTES